ncbi:MAG: AbrB/MazE/SpoVT family DNA-binding domain-containing protein [Gemmatimonadetes bacterium]|uniref:AbrB/MazE/SpoVT family DNA-binding domain-containing protein n=1 Tax=Candidatus Kutchimonas denitrificans TaxID=3056748 RepID=A0AAE4Z8F0_9BACT|nr:AbrB/MazE/SpoVT family DNA-binding domain-containing protein [Gemmatimonadota bacterium]NIR74577.1 AbrB/MazE/SpoVT family DNA-binding domain-containing protein [Candidatus Kutchimonas denitrificans]NIS02767.1 AbrB/MazE/SpoVT family DNA-binding domain-containing protein [Gemmatimonadota bacterium]NIT68928.1 AbrB/MazE/SpoVT family DNA-binding domain-containing protein [Gemmatimonadota bacterium]NIU52233.1 AbrB/MazE/SpoVT family DNA-binding domain-containing protein [Gemmatimonadota bacterium]
MPKQVKARKMGGSVGTTLPREFVDRYHIKAGDLLTVIETSDGILITPFNPEFEKAMTVYERGARKFRNALRELASS